MGGVMRSGGGGRRCKLYVGGPQAALRRRGMGDKGESTG